MENKPINLDIKNMREVKTYSLVWFRIHETLASSQVYLVDKKNRKVWMYQMNRAAKDETAMARRRYESNLKKDLLQRMIGGELHELMMDMDSPLFHLKVIAHSDSALEITEKLYEVRALQAELYLRICHNHCHWASEEAAVEHFSSL